MVDVIMAGGGVVHNRKLHPELGVFFGQLLVGGVEAEIISYLAAPFVDLSHYIVTAANHAVTVEILATCEQQDRNHLKQDEEDDEVMF